MITLITGGPGMGKTALAVKMLITQYKGRPIFSNIRGLKIDHSKLPKIEEWTEEVYNEQGTSEHRFTFPAGSIIVIDECQQFFRPRPTGSKVPPYVSAFETHRHQGIDFILITQGSGLLDANIRKLVKGGLHIYLRQSFLGRERIEKAEVMNEDDKSSYSLGARRKYRLPKEVFHLYNSAEVHTKPTRAKLPWAVYVIIGGLILGAYFGWHIYEKVTGAIVKENKNEGTASVTNDGEKEITGEEERHERQYTNMSAANTSAVPERIIEAMIPVDDHNHLSAPLYADVLPPVTPPQIIGCIASKRVCTCYSQQQTHIWVPEPQCRARAEGRYYDPYKQTTGSERT